MGISEAKAAKNLAATAILAVVSISLVVFIALIVKDAFQLSSAPAPALTTASHLSWRYTSRICDDASQTEDHRAENLNPPYIDITLREVCFGGFVAIPDAWTTWQTQLLHNDSSDWVAEWYRGWTSPAGPFSHAEVDAGRNTFNALPSKFLRLEGKGTLRIYRVTGQGATTPPLSEQ